MASVPLLRGIFPHADLYDRALSLVYQLHTRIIDPSWSAQKDPEIHEKVSRDLKVQQLMEQRKAETVANDWRIDSRDEDNEFQQKQADVVKDGLEEIQDFASGRMRLANCTFLARSFEFVEGRRKWISLGGIMDNWWVPTHLKNMDKDRFAHRPGNPRRDEPLDVPEIWSVRRVRWEKMSPQLPIISCVHSDEERKLGYGRPLMDAIYTTWWMRSEVLQSGLEGLDRWANGIIHGEVSDALAADDETIDEIADDFLQKLIELRGGHAIVTRKGAEEVTILSGSAQGGSLAIDLAKYLDDILTAGIMGSILPFGGGDSGGSLARARVESDTSNILIQLDRKMLDESITKGLVKLFCRLNQRLLVKHGIFSTRTPIFKTHQAHHEDPQGNVELIASALGAGMPVLKKEAYEKIGLTAPSEAEIKNELVFMGTPGGGAGPFGGDPFGGGAFGGRPSLKPELEKR